MEQEQKKATEAGTETETVTEMKTEKSVKQNSSKRRKIKHDDCPVCCEPFNLSFRKECKCLKCGFSSCRECLGRYILSSIDDAQCMSCKAHFERQELADHMTQRFLTNGYKAHRMEVVFEKEKSKIPETQPFLADLKRKKELEKEQAEISNAISDLHMKLRVVHRNIRRIDEAEMRNRTISGSSSNSGEDAEELVAMRGPCPTAGCRGFISVGWRCAVCDVHVCRSCMVVREEDDEHVCKREDLESVKLIRKDCKPCPKCGVRIHKIEGCNQFWCTNCNTAFCWRTGKILSNLRYFHNPHHAAWLSSQERGGRHVQGCISFANLDQMSKWAVKDGYHERNMSTLLRRLLLRANEISDNQISRPVEQHARAMRRLRMRFLQGNISEENYKKEIESYERIQSKNQEVEMVLDTMANCVRDRMSTLYGELEALQEMHHGFLPPKEVYRISAAFLKDIRSIENYASECGKQVCKWYGMNPLSVFKHPLYEILRTKQTFTYDRSFSLDEYPEMIFVNENYIRTLVQLDEAVSKDERKQNVQDVDVTT